MLGEGHEPDGLPDAALLWDAMDSRGQNAGGRGRCFNDSGQEYQRRRRLRRSISDALRLN